MGQRDNGRNILAGNGWHRPTVGGLRRCLVTGALRWARYSLHRPRVNRWCWGGNRQRGGAAYADLIKDRPEADAIICWRIMGSGADWPTTAMEAEDVGRHACVRVSYSVRFDPPQWRAFVDATPNGAPNAGPSAGD